MSDGTTPAFAFEPRQVATSLPIGREDAEAPGNDVAVGH
jgi:hypothetical protein